jgi:outer membrane immunogenic protein
MRAILRSKDAGNGGAWRYRRENNSREIRMRRLVMSLTAAGLSIGLAAAASAADLGRPAPAPVYTKAPLVEPATWTGWYAGLNAGGDWGASDGSTSMACPGGGGCIGPPVSTAINALGSSQSLHTSGFTGGVQGGYNWQSGIWVVGFETEFDYFRSAGSNSATRPSPALGDTHTLSKSVSTDWLLTARPRVGVASGNWLVYGTGGLAVTQLKANWSFHNSLQNDVDIENAAVSAAKAGWTVGAGVETALAGRWTVGLEYLFVDFGSISASSTLVPQPGGPGSVKNVFSHATDLTTNIVRARINKQF